MFSCLVRAQGARRKPFALEEIVVLPATSPALPQEVSQLHRSYATAPHAGSLPAKAVDLQGGWGATVAKGEVLSPDKCPPPPLHGSRGRFSGCCSSEDSPPNLSVGEICGREALWAGEICDRDCRGVPRGCRSGIAWE